MPSKNIRYKDPVFPRYGKTSKASRTPTPPVLTPSDNSKKKNPLPKVSFDAIKNLNTDDYILLFLIFMLIKNNESPDWPLIASLGYILFDFDNQ